MHIIYCSTYFELQAGWITLNLLQTQFDAELLRKTTPSRHAHTFYVLIISNHARGFTLQLKLVTCKKTAHEHKRSSHLYPKIRMKALNTVMSTVMINMFLRLSRGWGPTLFTNSQTLIWDEKKILTCNISLVYHRFPRDHTCRSEVPHMLMWWNEVRKKSVLFFLSLREELVVWKLRLLCVLCMCVREAD